jgi:hypothetical protein
MCYVAAIPYIAMAVTAVAGVQEARAQKAAGNANAQIDENNARLSDVQAKDEANLSAREQQQAAWRTRDLIGQQKAALAANMVDSGTGTGFDLLGETAQMGGAEQSALAMEGARKAWGLQSQALNFRNEGAQAKWMGKTQSRITLLRTIGQVGSMYSPTPKPAGGFSGANTGSVNTVNTGANYGNYT